MLNPDIQNYITELRALIVRQGIKPNTVKASLVEHAYIVGIATAKGGVHKLPPAIAMCAMSGRSILTLEDTVL